MQPEIILHEGRESSLLRGHPWIFSNAVDRIAGIPKAGDFVTVRAADGSFLCRGHYSPHSQIRIRALSFDESETDQDEIIAERIRLSCARRGTLFERGNEGMRLIAAEGDFLPGLTVDKYQDFLVVSITTQGMEKRRAVITATLKEMYPQSSGYERSDSQARTRDGLKEAQGVLWGEAPPPVLYVLEEGRILLPVDIAGGHKTGAYLDQRASRLRAFRYANGAKVLNCFSYTGGFGLWALAGGARHVTNIDSSQAALDAAKAAVAANHLDPGHCSFVRADAFVALRELAQAGRSFDLVILDPPKFAERTAALKAACRGYQEINRLGLILTRTGGTLLTFSCSGLVKPHLFQKIVADAAIDAGVNAQITAFLSQASDHPVALPCPETHYLKGLEINVLQKNAFPPRKAAPQA